MRPCRSGGGSVAATVVSAFFFLRRSTCTALGFGASVYNAILAVSVSLLCYVAGIGGSVR